MQIFGCVLALAYAVFQFWAAFDGMYFYGGAALAVIVFAVCVFFRFFFPVTVFQFLGAYQVWEWHWFWALLFAVPGLLFVIPSVLAGLIGTARAGFKR